MVKKLFISKQGVGGVRFCSCHFCSVTSPFLKQTASYTLDRFLFVQTRGLNCGLSINKNKLTGSSSCHFCWKQPTPPLILPPPTLSQSYLQAGRMGLSRKQQAICPVVYNAGCRLLCFQCRLGLGRLPRDVASWDFVELVQLLFDDIIWTQYLAQRMCSTNIC